MFSATLNAEIRPVCKKFMRDVRTAWPYRHCAAFHTTAPQPYSSAARLLRVHRRVPRPLRQK
jgi:hypothetical protein